jgi:hypothetical protein
MTLTLELAYTHTLAASAQPPPGTRAAREAHARKAQRPQSCLAVGEVSLNHVELVEVCEVAGSSPVAFLLSSVAVNEAGNPFVLGAVRTAEDAAIMLHAMTHNANPAMRASRREHSNGTLKAVEDKRLARHGDLESLVIIVAALCTLTHDTSPSG